LPFKSISSFLNDCVHAGKNYNEEWLDNRSESKIDPSFHHL
jgi:hypothetical protein